LLMVVSLLTTAFKPVRMVRLWQPALFGPSSTVAFAK
jgi:hypothetical protein